MKSLLLAFTIFFSLKTSSMIVDKSLQGKFYQNERKEILLCSYNAIFREGLKTHSVKALRLKWKDWKSGRNVLNLLHGNINKVFYLISSKGQVRVQANLFQKIALSDKDIHISNHEQAKFEAEIGQRLLKLQRGEAFEDVEGWVGLGKGASATIDHNGIKEEALNCSYQCIFLHMVEAGLSESALENACQKHSPVI